MTFMIPFTVFHIWFQCRIHVCLRTSWDASIFFSVLAKLINHKNYLFFEDKNYLPMDHWTSHFLINFTEVQLIYNVFSSLSLENKNTHTNTNMIKMKINTLKIFSHIHLITVKLKFREIRYCIQGCTISNENNLNSNLHKMPQKVLFSLCYKWQKK